ncbi:Cold-shock protein [Corynebacterium pseudotuberculosis]|uniref:cold-shock protein n=1 Tax=Corynebacterium pseudotuberculosis TaxID=1719 RepID=UPI0009B68C58|nr:cold shock domain-containing protein [Corynebacterium pseudotuberculosis]ARB43551.1 Cold-shock protein [Corynebacterium pseudotuberculosis]
MPIGRVRWYDPEKGYGFVSNPGDEDCYVGKNVLPAGAYKLEKGQRIEFDFAAVGKKPQALRIKILETPKTRRPQHRHKHSPEELHGMVSDLVTILELKVQPSLRSGRFPERKDGRQIAGILRAVAKELDS